MVTYLNTSTPKARKRHRCMLCHGHIEVGERYERATLIYEDSLYDFIECAGCITDKVGQLVFAWMGGWTDEGYTFDEAWEWAHEYAAESAEARRWLERFDCKCGGRCEVAASLRAEAGGE